MSIQNRTSNSVSREKYENMKHKVTKWYTECTVLKEEVERLTKMNKSLSKENEDLVDAYTPDNHELETENKVLRKDIRNLKRDNKFFEDKHRGNSIQLERDLFVKDGQIQRLEDSKKDLKERYIELKEDWREERRSNRKDN
jgi:FtsZ-binding cell division protein ZapB